MQLNAEHTWMHIDIQTYINWFFLNIYYSVKIDILFLILKHVISLNMWMQITHLYHKIELFLFIIKDTKSSKSKISNNNFPWRTANMRVDWLKRKRIIPSIGETKISMSIDRSTIIDKTHVTKFDQHGLGFREEDSNSGAELGTHPF